MEQFSGKKSQEVLDYLLKRRSVLAQNLLEPGPSDVELEQILHAAMRVPDHKKLCPWYFLVFKGDERGKVGEMILQIYRDDEGENALEKRIEIERTRFTRAPVVVGVIARARKGAAPVWEQALSAGAACMSLSVAANASGYGAQWLTEWYSYHPRFRDYLGLDGRDHVAGFVHIGTVSSVPDDRPRPDQDELVTEWYEGIGRSAIKKGDIYDATAADFPEAGFDFSKLYLS